MIAAQKAKHMPDVTLHEYSPFYDSSDLGPADWARLADDIRSNYLHFDGFVVLTGTDTMAYCATALSFMLENLGKPVVFSGSQIRELFVDRVSMMMCFVLLPGPNSCVSFIWNLFLISQRPFRTIALCIAALCEPYNDARRNLIMALIFASRDTINEVTIFFHDRLLRACRATKVRWMREKRTRGWCLRALVGGLPPAMEWLTLSCPSSRVVTLPGQHPPTPRV